MERLPIELVCMMCEYMVDMGLYSFSQTSKHNYSICQREIHRRRQLRKHPLTRQELLLQYRGRREKDVYTVRLYQNDPILVRVSLTDATATLHGDYAVLHHYSESDTVNTVKLVAKDGYVGLRHGSRILPVWSYPIPICDMLHWLNRLNS